MPDTPFGKGEGESKPSVTVKGPKGDKRRQQIMVGASIALVLLGYLTYRKMKSGQANGSGGATVTPATSAVPALPLTTGTDIPSGSAAPTTTTPFAAPTDTTGGGSIPVTSGTPSVGAPSSTVPPVTTPPPAVPATSTPAPVVPSKPTQAVTPPAAAHPALLAPVVTPHPVGLSTTAATLPGQTHPSTVSGTV
jgi:hypothetical protein